MYREIYLDNSATTRPYDEVIELMNDINKNVYGNPSSLHKKGMEAEKLVKYARETIAKTLDADKDEIYFTSGGTEANNLAILGYLEANPRKGKHIITSPIEHPSVLEVYRFLESKGYSVDYLDVDKQGLVDIESLKSKIKDDTSLISVIYVNNEIGTIQLIEEIIKIKNSIKKDIALHVDAVQAYGKMKITPAKTGIDIMTISSHKIHGPKGVGALYIKKGIKIKPLILGGGQESHVRSGTENVPGICGFALAADIIHKRIDENNDLCHKINKLFIEHLKERVEGSIVISPPNSSPFILNVSFDAIRAEVLLHHLETKNIYVSTGSACSSRKNNHSHVLKAVGLKNDMIEGAIRFSFSEFNKIEDVENTIHEIKEILPKISIKRGGKK